MKGKMNELEVDFIGGEGLLTKNEEKGISNFIKTQKLLKEKEIIHHKNHLFKHTFQNSNK